MTLQIVRMQFTYDASEYVAPEYSTLRISAHIPHFSGDDDNTHRNTCEILETAVRDNNVAICRSIFGLPIMKSKYMHTTVHNILLYCADHGFTEIIRMIGQFGWPVAGAMDDSRRGALHYAASRGDLEACRVLVHFGAQVTFDVNHMTPVHHAIVNGHLAVCEFLFREWKHAHNRLTRCVLHYAAVGDESMYAMLVAAGAEYTKDANGMTPLMVAAACGSTAVASYIITRTRIVPRAESNDQGMTPLHFSTTYGNSDITKLLVDLGWPMMSNDEGLTPLHSAIQLRDAANVQCILTHRHVGKFIDRAIYPHGSALMLAYSCGWVECIRWLICAGASTEMYTNANPSIMEARRNLLHAAVVSSENCACEVIRLLLQLVPGIINSRTGLGETALHLAASGGTLAAVRELLAHENVDVNLTNDAGATPLYGSVANIDICRLLIDNGVDVNAVCPKGDTALHYVARSDYNHEGISQVAELLLSRGAKHSVNQSGFTPIMLAFENHNVPLFAVRTMRRCGGDDAYASRTFSDVVSAWTRVHPRSTCALEAVEHFMHALCQHSSFDASQFGFVLSRMIQRWVQHGKGGGFGLINSMLCLAERGHPLIKGYREFIQNECVKYSPVPFSWDDPSCEMHPYTMGLDYFVLDLRTHTIWWGFQKDFCDVVRYLLVMKWRCLPVCQIAEDDEVRQSVVYLIGLVTGWSSDEYKRLTAASVSLLSRDVQSLADGRFMRSLFCEQRRLHLPCRARALLYDMVQPYPSIWMT